MRRSEPFLPLALTVLLGLTGGCAAGPDRFPSLSLREFERVQGSFDAPDSPKRAELRPAPLSVAQASEIAAALEQASARHRRFIELADAARPIVADAAGTGPEDRRWGTAQIEIAELDSRRSGTAVLLADLDRLYADTTLSFTERDKVANARGELEEIVSTEDRIIGELLALIGPAG